MRILFSTCAVFLTPTGKGQLRQFTGKDRPVIEYLDGKQSVQNMYADILSFLEKWIPQYMDFNRNYLTVALGCTGGQHRSVYLAEKLAAELKQKFGLVLTRHNELRDDERLTARRRSQHFHPPAGTFRMPVHPGHLVIDVIVVPG